MARQKSAARIQLVAIQSALQKVREGQYYDASQMVGTLINRCVGRGMDGEAVRLCSLFAKEFLKVDQFDLAATLGMRMVKIFVEFELSLNEERVEAILELFNPLPPTAGSDEANQFIERAIKWASNDDDGSDLVVKLHSAAGHSYHRSRQYGRAQGHLVFCGDAKSLASLINEWKENGYPSERELFVLRLILILLAKGDVNLALSVINSPVFGFNLDSPSFPPALQLSYLLAEACRLRNVDFFDTLQTKYMLVLRRDPVFKRLLRLVDQGIFGRQQNGGTGILDMLTNLS